MIELNLDEGGLDAAIGTIAALKLNCNVATIILQINCRVGVVSGKFKRAVDDVSDLLKTNPNIGELIVFANRASPRAHLLKTLLDGSAGDHLSSLQLRPAWKEIDASEASLLERYVKTNRNLKRLAITHASLQLVSAIATSALNHLEFSLYGSSEWIPDLGARLAQCSSIVSLSVILFYKSGQHDAAVESFLKQGICNIGTLRRLELYFPCALTQSVVVAIGSAVLQNRSLEHVAIHSRYHPENCLKDWSDLGLALRSVKSLNLSIGSASALNAMLPQLQGCESLEVQLFQRTRSIGGSLSSISSLPKVRRILVTILSCAASIALQDQFVEMVRSSSSITTAALTPGDEVLLRPSFQVEVDSFCVLNRVFGTELVGFGPTSLWSRVFAMIHDSRARATFLFRLLREKPELIVSSILQPLSCDTNADRQQCTVHHVTSGDH